MRVTGLFIYPIKGCRGTAVASARATDRGFEGDRRWMVVDDDGRFLTQRQLPRMTLVRCFLRDDAIELEAPGLEPHALPRAITDGPGAEVSVWSTRCEALVDVAASTWMTRALERSCRVVYMPDAVHRAVAGDPGGALVSFADAYPYLLATEASLADLGRRLPAPLPMERFRPNLVLDGTAPFAEDDWRTLRAGPIEFRAAKGCDRCAVTTVDPATGEVGVEPLRTLATFRKREGKVWFGVNLVMVGAGVVAVGDAASAT